MSVSSVALLTNHLNASQQKEITDELLAKLQNIEAFDSAEISTYVSTLCELINAIPSIKEQVYPQVLEFSENVLGFEKLPEYYELLSLLAAEYSELPNALMDYIVMLLKQFVVSNPIQFNEELKALISVSKDCQANYDLNDKLITSVLNFAEWYFMNHQEFSISYKNIEFDHLCYLFLSNETQDISKAASKTLRWRMPSICVSAETRQFLWKIIFLLGNSKDKSEITYSYTLWLRYFSYNSFENLKQSGEFQDLLSQDYYWWALRDGLISLVHEHKKFALTLVQMSVRSLSKNITSPIITWNTTKEEEYLDSWKRFCTLYEILGIDTAMNQAEAAKNDLIRIFSPDSLLPVPFALTIPSVGFRAAMERVKKFSLNLLFALPEKSMSLFKHDMRFISNVFLPFTMKSNHFNAYTNSDGTFECPFGAQLREFISKCITSLTYAEDINQMAYHIFSILNENRLTFGIARIYIAWGVLQGLEKKGSLALRADTIDLLNKLFETTAEGGILKSALQTIHLKCLLHTDISQVDSKSILLSIGIFVRCNGYQIYRENEEFFLDFLNTHYSKSKLTNLLIENGNELNVDSFTVLASIALKNSVNVSHIVPSLLSHLGVNELLIKFAVSEFDFKELWLEPLIVSKSEKLIQSMVTGSKALPIYIYRNCERFLSIEHLFSVAFWESLDVKPLFESVSKDLCENNEMETVKYSIAQFKFVQLCVEKCIFNPEFNLNLNSCAFLLKNVMRSVPKGTDATFYKAKDEVVSSVLKITVQLLKITEFNDAAKKMVMDMSLNVVSMSEYYSHSANIELMTKYVNNDNSDDGLTLGDAQNILKSLGIIWEDLIKDRLILNQRSLHQKFIKLLMNSKLLQYSIEDEELAGQIFKIADELIDQSCGRKALLPYLLQSIVDYQTNYNIYFESTTWLAKIIAKATLLRQSDLNIFKLDVIIGVDYDNELNLSGETLYSVVYGKPEISYRVHIMTICGSVKNSEFSKTLWRYILTNNNVFYLMHPKKRTDLEEQWKRIQLYSILLLTYELLDKETIIYYMSSYILPRLFKEASPLCRMYMEWLTALTIHKFPDSQDQILEVFEDGIKNQQPLIVTIFERVSILVAQKYAKDKESNFLSKFVSSVIIPTATSNRALNRHFSTSMACVIYQEIKKKNLTDFPQPLIDTLTKIFEIASQGESWTHYKTGDALIWDILEDMNLVSIAGGVLLKVSDRQIDAIYERHFNKFVSDKQRSLLRYPIGKDEPGNWVASDRVDEVRFDVAIDEYDEESSLLQTKSGAWSTVMEVDENGRAASQVKRSPLIVVSSLVDKAPNLGGICRLCDCLGAGWMTLDDLSVKENSEFKSVAVTADRWMPMVEVKMDDIAEFMKMKKMEGYTLIGLEQTDKSVELNSDLKFPEKSLILIGKEREGIPGDLLAELDMCVIIKQVGIVRSMNIQTATAVIVQAYSAQHC